MNFKKINKIFNHKIFNKKTKYSEKFLDDINLKIEKKVLTNVVDSFSTNTFSSLEEVRETKKYQAFEEVNDLLNEYKYFNNNQIKTKKWNFSLLGNFQFVSNFVEKKQLLVNKKKFPSYKLTFLFFFLFLPIVSTIIIRSLTVPDFDYSKSIFNPVFICGLFYTFGFIFLYSQLKFQFTLKTGGWSFIYYQVGLFIFSMLISLVISPLKSKTSENVFELLILLSQGIFEIILVIFYFKQCQIVKTNLFATIKKKWFIIIFTTIFLLILINLIFYIYNNIFNFHFFSSNQDSIDNLLKNGGIFAQILIFLSTVIIAPICEEIVFREGIYKICGNKYLALFSSAIIFSFVHVNIDIENFFQYFFIASMLSLTYFFTRSVAFTIPLHASINLIVLIKILSS
ncbi:CPBP family intramembrane metalloprotease [symbiont of Argiope bruennichi]|uniref:CPBP family intramembrane glutamic endopeptidase n=1 Tax=symbiont of Argiope bruennichi TaxID=2810479 RepID=UPI003DA58CF0